MAEKVEKILDIKVNYSDAIKAIAEYQKKIDAAREAEKNLKKQLKDGEISRQQYNEAMAASKIAVADYNDSIRIINKTVQNQIKQEKEQEGSLRALRAELSNLTAEYDSLSEAERKGVRGDELKNKINEVTDALKGAEEETQRYYRNVGNYKEAIKSVLGLNSEFANSILELANSKGGAAGFFDELRKKAKAFGESLLGLLKNPVFLALAGIAGVGMAFKWFYDYNKGIVEATRLTKQFTGLGGKELKVYRNEVQALSDTYGKDFQKVLQATNSIAKRFGIEQEEALRIVKDGFIAGADANGEYLSILKEYPAYFKEAGLSAGEFVALTANATQEGIFSDKGIDAIKEANIRIREMTTATSLAFEGIGMDSRKVQEELRSGAKTTFDIVQEVSAKLNELPESSSEVGAALADIFGAMGEDAGLQYIKTLKDIDTNLDNVKSRVGALGNLQEQQLKSQVELENALSGLFDMTGGTFEEVTTKAKIFVNDGLVAIINGVQNIIRWFKDWYNESIALRGIVQGIGLTFSMVYQIVKSFFESVAVSAKTVGNVLRSAFTLDWDGLKKGFADYIKETGRLAKEVGLNIANAVKESWDETVNGDASGKPGASSGTSAKQIQSGGLGSSQKQSTVSSQKQSAISLKDAESAVKAKQKELEEIRKAEDAMLALVKDKREQVRKEIEFTYSRQIEDLRARLNTETDLTVKARQAINDQIKALEQKKAAELQKLSEEELQKEIDNRSKLISLQLEAVKKGSEQEYQLRMQQLLVQRDAELADKELTEQMKLAIVDKYNRQIDDLVAQHEKEISEKQQEAVRVRMENEIMQLQQSGASELDILQEQAAQKLELLNSIQQQEGESEQEFLNRKLLANQEYIDAKKAIAEKEVEIEQAKYEAISSIASGLSSVFEALGDSNKGFAILSKTLALAEIAINTGKAIAAGVAQAQSVPFPANIAAIATTVTTILANIATAINTVKSAKFATGGLVTGPGTGTSDSIPAQLSNGESVMTARATSMFAPLLSSFNQMGGGVPINVTQTSSQTLGEDMLARAVAKGVQAIRPVVSVEEITRVNNRVKVLENLGSI